MRPAGVVVWSRIADVVVLSVEQHVGHARVRLVHADDVGACRILLILYGELLVSTSVLQRPAAAAG